MSRRLTIGVGLYSDKSGISAIVRVRPLPASERRFPHDTPPREMQAWRAHERARLLGEVHRPTRGTLAADAPRYLAQVQHLVGYGSRQAEVRAWLAVFGDKQRSRMTDGDIRKVRVRWLAAQTAPKTINNRVATLAHLYRLLDRSPRARRGEKAWTPCDPVEPLPVHRTPAVKVPARTITTVAATLRAHEQAGRLRDAKTRARFMVLATTGKRASEVMRAAPVDVDLERRVWTPRDGKGGYCPGIYLNEEMLAAWRLFVQAEAWGAFRTGSLSRVVRTAGWPADVRVYNLRHGTGIELSERGHDLADIQAWMGHRRMETTRRHYVPVINSRLQAMSEALDHRFGWAAEEQKGVA